MSLKTGEENTFKIDTLIYELGDDVESIAYIVKGSVWAETAGSSHVTEAGRFICIDDMFNEFYEADYYAAKDSVLMIFPAADLDGFINFLKDNPSIHEKYYEAICSMMSFMYTRYLVLYDETKTTYTSLVNMYERYLDCCRFSGTDADQFIMPHDASLYDFEQQNFAQTYNVFLKCCQTPGKLALLFQKSPTNFLKQELNMIGAITTAYEDMSFYLNTLISLFAGKSQNCLFYIVSKLPEKIPAAYMPMVMALLEEMKETVMQTDERIKQATGLTFDIDYNRINFYFMTASDSIKSLSSNSPAAAEANEALTESGQSLFEQFINSDFPELNEDGVTTGFAPSENGIPENEFDEKNDYNADCPAESKADFSGNLALLCKYAHMDNDFYKRLNSYIETYMSMSDKLSRDDKARIMRHELIDMYFTLYEKVFFEYVKDSNPPVNIRLYLDFGVLDERLLNERCLEYIEKIPPLADSKPCRVYRMSEWLTAIFKGEKLPSKNEFDKDYVAFVRDKKRAERLSIDEERRMLNDADAKVKYEINNLLKYNCRILSGNMLAFTPMLSAYDFDGDLEKFCLDSASVNEAIGSVLAVDYSAFYREQMYSEPEKKIAKEVIQVQVFPDIILFPVYGVNTVMWQDLSGKKSNTPGRFLLPCFFRGDINNSILSMIGRFRWELCKSVMGTAWNNISVPSLTAEYADYIQFYRKNKELSPEKKEALKNQISRCRSNTREVFAADYCLWVKYESTGAIRLNRVARNILATYCPFSKELRKKAASQPIYADAMKRFNINHQKKINEFNMHLRALQRNGAEITEEILNTQKFYEL